MYTPLPENLPCGDTPRKSSRGLQANSQLHHGAQATMDTRSIGSASTDDCTGSMANRACSFVETTQNPGLALGGKICVGHVGVEADLSGPSREESAQRSETATLARHLAARLDNVLGEIISNQPMRADRAFQQIPEARVHHFVDCLLIQRS